MTKKQKLELTWVGKENRPRLEPRILVEEPGLSHHAAARGEGDLFDNRLIQGDNLLALKALEAEFAGQVKCVFIDPPYNTGSAFEHYDDGLEHSLWLGMMRNRLELIRHLLRPDGSLWVTLDDNEAHYFKVMCDEVFGRKNFISDITWQHSVQGKNDAKTVSSHHNHVLAYARDDRFQRNLLPRSDEHNVNYRNTDSDPNGLWRSGDVRSPNYRENLRYVVVAPNGNRIQPPNKGWRWAESTFKEKVQTGEITFVDGGTRVLRKIYLKDQEGRVPESIWFSEEVGTTREATAELRNILSEVDDLFPTPKPERLAQRILTIATNPGDLVLDSFAGSGTAGAVAHKMGRRWIMVELGEHARTHIVPRLDKVIDGQDPGGVTAATGWTGGGGYRFFRLAPSLLEYDKWGREVISKAYNPAMLAEALCKLEGFRYAPSESEYWNHGHSTEHDFLYVTTQTLAHEQLRDLSEQVGEGRTLLVLCGAYRGDARSLPNLTVKKIPDHVRDRCEWGRDDYSLEIEALPPAPELAAVAGRTRDLFSDVSE